MEDAAPASDGAARPTDLATGLRIFVGLDAAVRLVIWTGALIITTGLMVWWGGWPGMGSPDGWRGAWVWGRQIGLWVLLYNVVYVAELVLLRLLVPMPKEGRYDTSQKKPDRNILFSCLIALLTKARYEAPFPGFLVFHIANLPPMVWLMNAVFGPRSKSCYATDPTVLDPHLVTIGRNVTVGFRASIAGHYQDRDIVVLKRTVIEDNVVIGGHAAIFGGVHIKRGAVIGAGSVVLPNAVIGENEFWWGVPARRIKRLQAAGQGETPAAAAPESGPT